MRVLQLGPYPPPHGGVQTNLVALRNFLLKRQIPCAVINITRHRKPDAHHVYYPRNAVQLLHLLLKLQYDIIHLHMGGMLTRRLLGLGLVCCSIPRSKAVLTFHSGGYPSTPQGRTATANSLAGFSLRCFDGLIGVNPEIVAFFRQLGVQPERARLIRPHAFVDDEPRADLPTALARFFANHRPVLISVGLLEPEYDLPLQIEVLGHLRKNIPNAGLVTIGSGSLEDDLRKRIRVQPYAEHILLAGDVEHHATMQAISESDVMLRTTFYDGDAVSVREALHLGTPVIATDNGMRPPGVTLIPSQSLSALQQAIEHTLASPRAPRQPTTPDESNLQAVLDFYQELLTS
jgi:glycogen(starch) synthase